MGTHSFFLLLFLPLPFSGKKENTLEERVKRCFYVGKTKETAFPHFFGDPLLPGATGRESSP